MGKDQYVRLVVSCFLLLLLFPLCMSMSMSARNEEGFYRVGLETFQFKGGYEVSAASDGGDAESIVLPGGGVGLPVEHSLTMTGNESAWMDSLLQMLKMKNVAQVNAAQIPVISGNQNQGAGYTVTLGLGIPSQRVAMTLDTANSLSWVECGKLFNPTNSKSFLQTKCGGGGGKCPPLADPSTVTSACNPQGTCTFQAALADGSKISGEYITEVLKAGQPRVFKNFHMGCGRHVGQEVALSSGVLALSRSPLSMPAQTYGGLFSYCLPNFLSQRPRGSLWLGQGSIPASVKIFTPMQSNPDISPEFYLVHLEAVSVGRERFNVAQQIGGLKTATMIETANLVTQLVAPAYEALRASFLKQTSHLKRVTPYGILDTCFQLSAVQSARIPALTFHFKGNANLVVKDIGILLLVKPGVACLAFAPAAADNPLNIIASAQQQGIRLAFDNVRNQIGFAPNSC